MGAILLVPLVCVACTPVEREVGMVEVGKRVDVPLLYANPSALESIGNIRSVKYVITNDAMYDCAELWRSVGFQP